MGGGGLSSQISTPNIAKQYMPPQTKYVDSWKIGDLMNMIPTCGLMIDLLCSFVLMNMSANQDGFRWIFTIHSFEVVDRDPVGLVLDKTFQKVMCF